MPGRRLVSKKHLRLVRKPIGAEDIGQQGGQKLVRSGCGIAAVFVGEVFGLPI